MSRIEHKSIPAELKMSGDDNRRIAGSAAVMLNIDAGQDIIAPGAFAEAIKAPADIFVGGLNHNWDQPIGRLREAREDGKSLYFETGDIVETTHGLDVKKLVNAGVINRASIGYKAVEFKHLNKPDEVKSFWKSHGYSPDATDVERAASGRVRVLTRLKLFEVSPVTIPMNDRAAISAVKMFGMGGYGMPSPDPDDMEDAIRDSVVRVIQEYQWQAICAIVRNDMLGGDDRLALIGPVFDQSRDALLRYLKPLLGGEAAEDVMEDVADTLETMGKSLMARLPEGDAHQYTVKALALESGASLDSYFPAVDTALRDFSARNRFRLDLRVKEGRVLSATNVERIRTMRDKLREHADDLHEMVESATPRPKDRSPFGGLPTGVMATVSLGGKSAEPADDSPDVEAKGGHPVLEGPWDAKAAETNVRKWASSDGSGDKDTLDWEKYGRAFAHVAESKAGPSFAAHHLIHHDVADGKLHVSRKGVLAAASADHPEAHAGAIRGHLGGHFDALKMTAPWDRGNGEGKSADTADDAAPSAPPMPDFSAYFKRFYATDPGLLGLDVAIK